MAGNASVRLTEPTEFIRKALGDMGANVMGFADLAREIVALGEDVSKKYPIAISFGLLVSKGVLETLIDGPTSLYLHHYRQVNSPPRHDPVSSRRPYRSPGPQGPAAGGFPDGGLAAPIGAHLPQARGRGSRNRMDREKQSPRSPPLWREGEVQHGSHGHGSHHRRASFKRVRRVHGLCVLLSGSGHKGRRRRLRPSGLFRDAPGFQE